MTKAIWTSALALIVAAMTTVAAQTKPNFSGSWTRATGPIITGDGGGGGRLGGGGMALGQEFTATQDEKTLAVVQKLPKGGEIKSVYKLDGSKTSNPIVNSGGRHDGLVSTDQAAYRVSKVTWDGDRLVVTTTSSLGRTVVESRQTWSLDASGALTIESTQKWAPVPSDDLREYYSPSAYGGPITIKNTYKKA
ncbi:MAG TPA: hypothetical protein VN700_12120 [Vicinamibacterales bacterium]|nr:hypothetical protein [Vicinamibacterales bacterium]